LLCRKPGGRRQQPLDAVVHDRRRRQSEESAMNKALFAIAVVVVVALIAGIAANIGRYSHRQLSEPVPAYMNVT
jgi:hypothetical protein